MLFGGNYIIHALTTLSSPPWNGPDIRRRVSPTRGSNSGDPEIKVHCCILRILDMI